MKNKIFLIFSIFLFFLMPLISANGLAILGNSTFEINKIQGIDYNFTINLENQEPITFYNIQPNNNLIEFNSFNLTSGENKTIQISITQDEVFNGEIRIKPFYFASLGSLNQTYTVNVNYPNGVDICDQNLIKGDKIEFKNLANNELVLRNYDTNNDVQSIQPNQTYTINFDNPETFRYYFLRSGYAFSQICTINVLDDQGKINNPDLDGIFTLDLKVNFKPTQIQTNFLTKEYTMDFDKSAKDIFSIKNTGNEVAKNIQLSGNWISFSENNFDLQAGESRNIGYTISPTIFSTEETNKTYVIPISVKGNFNSTGENISVKINYQNINVNGNFTISDEIIGYLIEKYCQDHKDEEVCERNVYQIVNESNSQLQFNMSEKDLNNIWGFLFDESDQEDLFENWVKEQFYNQSQTIGSMSLNNEEITSMKEKIDNQNSIMILFIIMMIFMVGMGIIIFLLLNKQAQESIRGFFNR